jgi:hypothetical protein
VQPNILAQEIIDYSHNQKLPQVRFIELICLKKLFCCYKYVGGCYAGSQVGYFVSGAAMYGWTDTTSYNSDGIWNNVAMKFEKYDLDICYGHSASGVYHR